MSSIGQRTGPWEASRASAARTHSKSWSGKTILRPAQRRGGPMQPRIRGWWVQASYALIDIMCILASSLGCFGVRFGTASIRNLAALSHDPAFTHHYGGFLLLFVGLTVLFCQSEELYWTPLDRSALRETVAVFRAVFFSTLLLATFLYLSRITIVSRAVVSMDAVLTAIVLATWRYAKRLAVLHRAERGIGARNAVIVGAGLVGQALARQFESNRLLGYRFVGFVDGSHSGDPRWLGRIEDLCRVVRAEFVDEIFITIPSERELVKQIVREAQQQRLSVNVIPELYDGLGWDAPLHRIGDFPVMDLHWQPIPALGLFAKRSIDVALSIVGMILCAPIFLIVAAAVRLDSSGPIFYQAPRVGRKGRAFRCVKFRTMVADADRLKESLRPKNERRGPIFKIADDPRITKLGKFLRRYSFDELPQFWNVLVGDMSLVGPRPHPLDDYRQYDLDHRRRLEVKPGITGLWQVTARQDPSFETNMRLDLQYIENWNLKMDFEILARTFGAVLRAEGC